MPRIEIDERLHEIEDCPHCGRTLLVESGAACGFIAPCGRRLLNLQECGIRPCIDNLEAEMQEAERLAGGIRSLQQEAMNLAAEEITRLRAERDRLREALQNIANLPDTPSDILATACNIAHYALNEQNGRE